MSSLWTPGGEVPVDREAPRQAPAADPDGDIDPADLLAAILSSIPEDQRDEFQAAFAELTDEERDNYLQAMLQRAEIQRQVVESPVEMQIANHAAGLFELAALHLQHPPPHLPEAKLAIDALAGLLGAVGDQLGDHGAELRAMLSQIQLAFVQVQGSAGDGEAEAPDA